MSPKFEKILTEFLGANLSEISFDGKSMEFRAECGLIQSLREEGIAIAEENGLCSIDLTLPQNDINIYYHQSDFLARYKTLDNFENSCICILTHEKNFLICKRPNASFSEDISIIFNFHYYLMILEFLLSSTDFISYSNRPKKEFVLIDNSGPTEVQYDLMESKVEQVDSLQIPFERLVAKFTEFEFQQFFKDAVLLSISKVKREDRFFKIIEGINIFLDQAEKDFKLYLKKFAFENIKTRFKEERVKYFESIEKNIDAINKQVIAFPLTFSASIFASYQVKEKPIILFFILLAYLLYTIIAWMILAVSSKNLSSLKSEVEQESEAIRNIDSHLFSDFEADFAKIFDKIGEIKRLTLMLKFSLIFLLALFVGFATYQSLTGKLDSLPDTILTSL